MYSSSAVSYGVLAATKVSCSAAASDNARNPGVDNSNSPSSSLLPPPPPPRSSVPSEAAVVVPAPPAAAAAAAEAGPQLLCEAAAVAYCRVPPRLSRKLPVFYFFTIFGQETIQKSPPTNRCGGNSGVKFWGGGNFAEKSGGGSSLTVGALVEARELIGGGLAAAARPPRLEHGLRARRVADGAPRPPEREVLVPRDVGMCIRLL